LQTDYFMGIEEEYIYIAASSANGTQQTISKLVRKNPIMLRNVNMIKTLTNDQ
jgi:hypothetical protein